MIVSSPWRSVEHSELRTNTRGREFWFVTLSCGHTKHCYMPSLFGSLCGPRPRSRTAPRKCRCQLCGALKRADKKRLGWRA